MLTLMAAPAAYAAKPDRTTFEVHTPDLIPAGLGCAFDVLWSPDGKVAVTTFGDGRTVTHGNGEVTLTNLDTGATFVHRARDNQTATYDAATNELVESVSGQVVYNFYPGDVGPWGVVSDPGMLVRFSGRETDRFSLDTFAYTSFSYSGNVTDVCAALAG